MKPSLAYPCQTLCLTIHIENSEICVAVTNRIWRGFELRSTCDHSTIRWLPVVVLWGINLSNVNFPEKLCSCDVGTEFSIIARMSYKYDGILWGLQWCYLFCSALFTCYIPATVYQVTRLWGLQLAPAGGGSWRHPILEQTRAHR